MRETLKYAAGGAVLMTCIMGLYVAVCTAPALLLVGAVAGAAGGACSGLLSWATGDE